ncbi:MAG: multidrug effflux MFS transporter [Tistlia sp.]|uniref:multidrug effflux MFS transporter n=1 Tax=Tistlia sp. TaxID=3057121 RepID=UPI0034A2D778
MAFAPRSRPVTILLILLVAFGPASTDLYLPALPSIARAFGADSGAAQLTLSVFLLGFALAMLAHGPLSDRFGRRPVLFGALAVYLAASLACAFAPSMELLILARFLQALGACAGAVIGRAIVRDVYRPQEAARVMSFLAMAMAVAPALAPILGGWLTTHFGWQATFLALLVFGLVALAGVVLVLPETNLAPDLQAIRPRGLASNYRHLLGEVRFRGYVLVIAGSYGGLFAFISGSSFALIDGLGLRPDQYGYCFSAAVLGYMSGSFGGGRVTTRLGIDRTIALGNVFQLAGGLAGLALALAGVFTVASVVAPAALFFFGSGFALPNATAGAINPFPRMAGAASGLMGFLQMAGAAVLGALVGRFQDGGPLVMMAAIAGAGLVAVLAHRLIVRRLPAA